MSDGHPAVSADGLTVSFSSNPDSLFEREIYVMNADGSGQTRLTDNATDDHSPVISPDGSTIAFRVGFVDLDDKYIEVYVMNADGSGRTRLTHNDTYETQLAFSPDGSMIAFSTYRHGDFEIYLMNVDGTDKNGLTNNGASDSAPTFSPDGTSIAYVHDAPRSDLKDGIYVMNVDGSDKTRLTRTNVRGTPLAFSPDGRKILLASHGRHYDLFTMNADGSGRVNLTNDAAYEASGAWGGRSSSAISAHVDETPESVRVRGVLEPATGGNRVTVAVAHREGDRWVTVSSTSVRIRRLGDRDADLRTDARYIAEFGPPGPGRYRLTARFRGDFFTLPSTNRVVLQVERQGPSRHSDLRERGGRYRT